MAKTLKEKVLEIAGLVYDLNKKTDHDWFFDFCGHVDIISVHYNKTIKTECGQCGLERTPESVYLALCVSAKIHTGLDKLIEDLESLCENVIGAG